MMRATGARSAYAEQMKQTTVAAVLAFAIASSLPVAGCWHEDRDIRSARHDDRRDYRGDHPDPHHDDNHHDDLPR